MYKINAIYEAVAERGGGHSLAHIRKGIAAFSVIDESKQASEATQGRQ